MAMLTSTFMFNLQYTPEEESAILMIEKERAVHEAMIYAARFLQKWFRMQQRKRMTGVGGATTAMRIEVHMMKKAFRKCKIASLVDYQDMFSDGVKIDQLAVRSRCAHVSLSLTRSCSLSPSLTCSLSPPPPSPFTVSISHMRALFCRFLLYLFLFVSLFLSLSFSVSLSLYLSRALSVTLSRLSLACSLALSFSLACSLSFSLSLSLFPSLSFSLTLSLSLYICLEMVHVREYFFAHACVCIKITTCFQTA